MTISRKNAIDFLRRRSDARLVLTMGSHGAEYHIIPDGGRIRPSDAQKIIHRREITVADHGLLVDVPQSWRYLRHA